LGGGSISALLGILTCHTSGIPFFLFGDSSFPPPADTFARRFRAAAIRRLFRLPTRFLVSGALNADYYRHYGAVPARFFLLPWAGDNERFAARTRLQPGKRESLRQRLDSAE